MGPFRKKETVQEDMPNLQDLARKATEFGRSFQKRLLLTEESMDDVEEILNYYAKDLIKMKVQGQPVPEYQIWSMAMVWGAYVGETLLHNQLESYRWEMEGNRPVLTGRNGDSVSPVDQVYLRLTGGSENNIKSFYQKIAAEGKNRKKGR